MEPIAAKPRPPGTFPRKIAHKELIEFRYDPATGQASAGVVGATEPVVVEWDRSPPPTDARDVGEHEVLPTRDGVGVNERVSEREIPVPMGIRKQMEVDAQREGGPVTHRRAMRVDHDIDSRETVEALVRDRTNREVQRIMDAKREADQSQQPGIKRKGKRGRQREADLRKGPMDIPEIIVLRESPPMKGFL